MIVSTLALAALSRAEMPQASRRPFFVYVDEFQSFTTPDPDRFRRNRESGSALWIQSQITIRLGAFVSMMAELRKYGVGLTLAHQHLHQLDPELRHAVLGNAGTLISFRVGAEDAPYIAREFQPTFQVPDLINLPNHHFYLRLMIDGAPSGRFSGRAVTPTQ